MGFLSRLLSSLTRLKVLQATIVIIMAVFALGCSKKPEVVGTWKHHRPGTDGVQADNSGVIQGKNYHPSCSPGRRLHRIRTT